jgi:hypothetical protein
VPRLTKNSPKKLAALASLVLALLTGASVRPAPAGAADPCQFPGFAAPVEHEVQTPISVTLADVNNDQKADLLTGDGFAGRVSVRLGDGAGGFGPEASFLAGNGPNNIALGDFNEDGKVDLLTSNTSPVPASVSILFGDGAGSFDTRRLIPVIRAGFPDDARMRSSAVGDFNGDSKDDFVVSTVLGLVVGLGDGAGNFRLKSFNAGPTLGGLVAGDFNNDQKLDVAVTNGFAGTVTVIAGDGAGNLGGPTAHAVGGNPTTVIKADFNLDGKTDLATTNESSENVSVLLGDGAGGFAPARNFASGNKAPSALGVGDFNGDAFPDLVVTNIWFPGNLFLLLGDGAGGFTPAASYDLSGRSEARDLAVADLNADGRDDVVTVHDSSDVAAVFLGLCDSAPAPQTLRIAGDSGDFEAAFGPSRITVTRSGPLSGAVSVDLSTSDGTATSADYTPLSLTLTFAEGETQKSVQLHITNDSIDEDLETLNLTLSNPTGGALIGPPNPAPFFILDNDEGPGILIGDASVTEGDSGAVNATFNVTLSAASSRTVGVVYATAAGTATPGEDYASGGGTLTFAPGERSKALTFAVRGDAVREVTENFFVNLKNPSNATVSDAQGVGTILDDDSACPVPSFGAPSFSPFGPRAAGVAVGDFNADGKRDLAVANNFDGKVAVLLGNGAGGFAASATFAAGSSGRSVVTADFNLDGKADLAVPSSSNISILLGDGAGGFAPRTTAPAGPQPGSLAVGDFNNDGKPDLAATNSDGVNNAVTVLTGVGDGTFGAPRSFAVGTNPVEVAQGDFDGDGKADLAVANMNSDTVSVLNGDGAGGFAPRRNYPVGGFPHGVAAADVNGDGRPDLLVSNSGSNNVSVLLGGAGGFAPAVNFAAGAGPISVRVADFNLDGRLDLVTANRDNDHVSVAFGTGNGSFAAPASYATSGDPLYAEPADFDGDGRPDIAVLNANTAQFPVFLNTCTGAPAPSVQFSAAEYPAGEADRAVRITVTRTGGDTSGAATVNYATSDASASERSDYTTALGTLRFAPNEASKTFDVLLTDDALQEGEETLALALAGADGAALGPNRTATLRVADNDSAPPSSNPIDDSETFVRQHYLDFLNREPDAGGLNFWKNGIESCGADAGCRAARRVDTSTAFFLSIEFQRTGYQVFRVYKASFADAPARPRGLPRYRELLRDTQEIGRGVVVGVGPWDEQLRQNTFDFARRWVEGAEFTAQFPLEMNAAEFVGKLFANSEVTPTQAELDAAVAAFGAGGGEGRAGALLSVTDSASVYNRQYNPAFVLMQYVGYLRRSPDDAPDNDLRGFDFWLQKLDSFSRTGEDVRDERVALSRTGRAQMVFSFIDSVEYRRRFAP